MKKIIIIALLIGTASLLNASEYDWDHQTSWNHNSKSKAWSIATKHAKQVCDRYNKRFRNITTQHKQCKHEYGQMWKCTVYYTCI